MAIRQENERWLTAHHDPLASLYTFSSSISLADLHGDGDWKLIIADLGTGAYNMKLKVYKGTSLMSENTLIDLPTGVITFHMDTTEPRVPGDCSLLYIPVASASWIPMDILVALLMRLVFVNLLIVPFK